MVKTPRLFLGFWTGSGNAPSLPTSNATGYTTASNQVSSSNLMPGDGPLVYDAAGNVIQDSLNQYRYDAEGRICAVQSNATGSAVYTGYVYDAGRWPGHDNCREP
jgi:hypothetical protein